MLIDINKGCLPALEFSPLPACLLVGGSLLELKALKFMRKSQYTYTDTYNALWELRQLKGIVRVSRVKKNFKSIVFSNMKKYIPGFRVNQQIVDEHINSYYYIIGEPHKMYTGFFDFKCMENHHKLEDYHEYAKRCFGYWEAMFSSISAAIKSSGVKTTAVRKLLPTQCNGEMCHYYVFPNGRKFIDMDCPAAVSHITNFMTYNKLYNDRS